MATRLTHVVVDASDHRALARFWSKALDWPIVIDDPHEVEIGPGAPGDVPLIFVPAPTPKRAKNRIHIDITTNSREEQDAHVARVLALGAVHVDVGQGNDAHWAVLADPEGNEFCISGKPDFGETDTGAIAGFSLDAFDPAVLGRFWREATGWDIVTEGKWGVGLRARGGTGPFLAIWTSLDPKLGKNRLHLDVAPPVRGDHHVEAERLISVGARTIDIGQGDVPWIVLSDPDDNEFCVLTPR